MERQTTCESCGNGVDGQPLTTLADGKLMKKDCVSKFNYCSIKIQHGQEIIALCHPFR